MEAIQTEEYKGYTIKVYHDEMHDSPRDWDNLGNMICFHNRYVLGDKHEMGVEEIKEIVAREDVISLPLYLYDHSGITMSTSNAQYPFNCRWDSGQVGFIYVTRDEILDNWNRKKLSKALIEKAIKLLQSEVETYDLYLTGQVYSYVVEDKEGNVMDSCGGYLGDPDKYMMEEAKRIINHLIQVPNYQI